MKRTKTIERTRSDHNGVKLDINSINTARKPPNSWKLSNTLLNNPGVKKIQGIKHTQLSDSENSTDQPWPGGSAGGSVVPCIRVAGLIPGQGTSLG